MSSGLTTSKFLLRLYSNGLCHDTLTCRTFEEAETLANSILQSAKMKTKVIISEAIEKELKVIE